MSKYEPLTVFLKAKNGHEVRMTFGEIESVTGHKLPTKSKAIRAWWSNNPSNNVLTQAWLAAGYKSAQVDIAGEKISFIPVSTTEGFGEMKQSRFEPKKSFTHAPTEGQQPARHPLFGIWKGKVKLVEGYDYTQPADPDWGKLYED